MRIANPPRTGLLLSLAVLLIVACEKQNAPATSQSATNQKTIAGFGVQPPPVFVVWLRRDNIPSALSNFKGRFGGWSFVIGGKGYIGGGTAVTTNGDQSVGRNVFAYDTVTQSWSQQATPPSEATGNEGAFAIGASGYIVSGSGSNTQNNYQYNSLANTWTLRAPLPGAARQYSFGVATAGKGYIGGGANKPGLGLNIKDWMQYDPATDHWTAKAQFPGEPTYGAAAFASSPDAGGKAYFCGGYDNEGRLRADLWQYDPATDQWTQKTSLPGSARAYAVGMNTTTAGFISTGWSNAGTLADVWQYNFSTDTWGTEPNIPYAAPIVGLNGARLAGFGFGIGNTIYIGGGLSDNSIPDARADLWSLAIPN